MGFFFAGGGGGCWTGVFFARGDGVTTHIESILHLKIFYTSELMVITEKYDVCILGDL